MENVFRPDYRELSDDEKQLVSDLKDKANELFLIIDGVLGQGRELAIAKTKLEESVMWAVKGITK